MRTVVQRVTKASVTVDNDIVGEISNGLAVLVAAGDKDTTEDITWMASKLAGLRIFEDANGKMNDDICQIGGQILLIPQFTLYGDCRKGRRPGFKRAAAPEIAQNFVDTLSEQLRARGITVEEGSFGAHMSVNLQNDGPVTILLDSEKKF